MEVIVHIGAPKTGTSSIQQVLKLQHETLKDHGIYTWPYDPRSLFGIFEVQNKPLIPDERLICETRKAFTAWSVAMWEKLEHEVSVSTADTAILSSEHFIYVRDKRALWNRLSNLFERITVIAYMREPLDLYPSVINQRIRGGYQFASLPTPAQFPFGGYKRLLEHRTLLGEKAMHVKNFSKLRHKSNIVGSFFEIVESILGRDVPIERLEERENRSLSAQAVLWLLTLNESFDLHAEHVTPMQITHRNRIQERLRNIVGPPLSLRHCPELRACVHSAAKEYRKVLNAEFLEPEEAMDDPLETTPTPPNEDQRILLKKWLLSHLEEGELKRTADILLQLSK